MIFRISISSFDKQTRLSYLHIYHLDFRIKGTLIFIFLALKIANVAQFEFSKKFSFIKFESHFEIGIF
jgi:hypothetical protein